jgi:predicted Zn finger-like uncharacterized protein
MIIQCEQCRTKFRLDDSKVADKSIKVRCARCRNVFSVSGTQNLPEVSASFEQNAPVFQIEEELEAAAEPTLETALEFESATLPNVVSSGESSLLDSFSFDNEDLQSTPEPTLSPKDNSDFFLPAADSSTALAQTETQKDPDDLDFSAFEFGDDSGDADEPAVAAQALDFADRDLKREQVDAPAQDDSGGLDFSGDDMFGDIVSAAPEEETAAPISFDIGMDGFAESLGVDSSTARQSMPLSSQDSAAESPFSLDDIDFGDDLTSVAVQQVSTEELKPSQDLLFAPLAAPQTLPELDSAADIFGKAPSAPAQDEIPPLSITSRRKEGSRKSGMLILVGVIIAGLVIFYGTWGYKMLNEDRSATTLEAGQITVRAVEASFIKNKLSGDLLVISGEAVNEYNKPRAAIQIKGIVFGAVGEELSSKTAFCGNPLSKEQLSTMPMDKIEAAMANQFGDSLANMEVAPGNAIPFVIVMPAPPKGATDYGVEPVGSTVATEKEKQK